ncbi:myo-inosose-2 dehydratase [Alicyclobacillus mali (ex Roth et al. 2021)]|uniref:myo-inosose-2 dehydratase n=1 Tax=Alicyclobacillus mali (ex Roth et al. 2021) TaxID=1123961 RepID=UPI000A451641|nr:myo-inosose-2 dehydratase [Alicyclobacillus mali (ex Roth et al. 2021)]
MSVEGIRWGISPIGWRNDDMPELGAEHSLGHVLSDMAVAGFEGTEVGGFFPEPEVLRRELELRGLDVAGQWFSSYLLQDGFERVDAAFRRHCARLAALRADVAVVSEQTHSVQGLKLGVFDHKPKFTADEWDTLVNGLNRLGATAKEYGLMLVYHPHLGTGIQTRDEIDTLMRRTDPETVHLLYDTGHLFASDEDVLTVLALHGARIRHVHFKDVRRDVLAACRKKHHPFLKCVLDGIFTVPGDGCIDFVQVFRKLHDFGYQGWIVIEAEQDPARAHPLEYALRAKRYVDELVKGLCDRS